MSRSSSASSAAHGFLRRVKKSLPVHSWPSHGAAVAGSTAAVGRAEAAAGTKRPAAAAAAMATALSSGAALALAWAFAIVSVTVSDPALRRVVNFPKLLSASTVPGEVDVNLCTRFDGQRTASKRKDAAGDAVERGDLECGAARDDDVACKLVYICL